ncbi:CD81 antigen-like [Halichoeres trimaculatus]|uniref:CD81 antigen-like n=1 Tax=Halichoeres trimaculatus TaxID=147232 RepID=UPI003D9E7834
MGVEGCTKFIKYLLFFLNFIFWLAGGVILGVALWLRHEPQITSLLNQDFQGSPPPQTFYISAHILIAVGAVMMVVGFLGCYGAIQESQCLLGTFFACLVILFACEVAAGIWGFMNRDLLAKELMTHYDSVYDKAMTQSVTTTDKSQGPAQVLKVFHETLNCCGKGDGTMGLTRITDLFGVTEICPSSGTTVNCHTRIKALFSDKMYLIGIAVLVVAVIMIFEMIFSMVLCCGIRNSPVY